MRTAFVTKQKGEPMDDLISRQAAINAFYDRADDDGYVCYSADDMEGIIKTLPSVQQRKTGKWIPPVPRDNTISYGRAYWECDQCHKAVCWGNEMKFCPNCGARMEEHNETD